ncbi:MAG: hypothetical protein ACXAEU_03680 [Candidatus Hodarchaeales archaeon]|jgi:hypothetical protein
MVEIRYQMIIQEKSLFTILERSFGTTIDKITIPTSKRRKFDKLVFKLVRTHPRQLQRLIKSEFNF